MKQTGPHIGKVGIEKSGLKDLAAAHWNYNEARLYEEALRRGEGHITVSGALAVTTGQHTGRSAQDKFVLRDADTEDTIWWDNNKPISQENFDRLKQDFLAHAAGRELFVQDLFGGADPAHRLPARIFTEYAWHSLFIRYLLRVPAEADYETFDPELTIINLPSFSADPAVAITRAPAWTASCTAAVPRPPAAAWIRMVSPPFRSARSNSASHARWNGVRMPDAVDACISSGTSKASPCVP